MKKTTLFTLLFGFIFGMNAQLDFYNLADDSNNGYPQVTSSATVLYDASSGTSYDDEETSNVPIGFDFYYRGTMYNTCTVGVNGAISFTETQISNSNYIGSTDSGRINMVAPFWDDLKLYDTNSGYIKYETTGTAPDRIFTVSWYNISKFGDGTNDFSFLVQLHEGSNDIVFYYGHIDAGASSLSGSIGMNANDGTSTSYVSMTPGSPATMSTTNVNNSIDAAAFPEYRHYTLTFDRAYNDWDFQALPITLAAPRDATHLTYYVNNTGATNSHGTEPTCAGFQGGDVWFKYIAPATGAVNLIRTEIGGIGDLGFAVYHNTQTSAIQLCDNAQFAGTRYLIKDLVAGDTYYIRLWDYNNNDFGITKFYLETIEVNDEAANAKDITVQPSNSSMFVMTSADNTFVTGSEATNGTPACASYSGGDLWYKFTATSSGEIKIVHTDAASGDWSSLGFAVYDSPTANTAIDCDVIYITGVTPPYVTPVISGLTDGQDYWLRVWDYGDNNIGNSGAFYLTDNVVGIEAYESLSFKFYPNPTTDILNVTADDNIDLITLTNLLGQEVRRLQPNQNETSINVADLQKGVYLMNVQTGDKISTVKVIKQ